MNISWIERSLREVKRDFRPILDDSAEDVIDEAIAELLTSKSLFEQYQGKTHHPGLAIKPWGYRIHPEAPLRFRESKDIKGHHVWTDLYCTMLWEEEGAEPVEQVIHMRVWSDSPDLIYRVDWDSTDVFDKLASQPRLPSRRVMFRYHFDRANIDQPGPKYHLQFGGSARGDELCWFPEVIKLPRLAYPPMDLILACQSVAANFHWKEYNEFRKTPEWISVLRKSQSYLLRDYYQGCLSALDHDLLTDHLWNYCAEGSS